MSTTPQQPKPTPVVDGNGQQIGSYMSTPTGYVPPIKGEFRDGRFITTRLIWQTYLAGKKSNA